MLVVFLRAQFVWRTLPYYFRLLFHHDSSTMLVVGANIKYNVHIEILIYHLIFVIGLPFDNHVIILFIRRHNAASIVNT